MYPSQKPLFFSDLLASVGEFLHGTTYVLNGVQGVFRYEEYIAKYPSPRWHQSITHWPDEVGRQSPEYRKILHELGSSHCSDLTNSERLFDIAFELGYGEAA